MKKDSVLHYRGYTAKPEYSAEDKVFYGTLLGIDDVVDFMSDDAKQIEAEFHSAVDEYLDFCKEIGKEPQKAFSGQFNVRITPELHRRIYLAAREDGVSLNKEVEKAISAFL